MPYPNVPRHLTAKMDRCVQSVMRQSKLSKPKAIATCFTSIVKELGEEAGGQISDIYIPILAEMAVAAIEEDIKTTPRADRGILLQELTGNFEQASKELTSLESMTSLQAEIFMDELRPLLLDEIANAPVVDLTEEEGEEAKEEPMAGGNSRQRRREKRAAEREAKAEADKMGAEAVAVEVWSPLGGSETWEELDQYLDAEGQKDATRQATYEFDKMVGNVLNNDQHSLTEKAGRIAALANGLPERVEDIQEKEVELEIEIVEEAEEGSWIDKIRTALKQRGRPFKTVDGVRLHVGDFASVGDPSKPTTWKLPLVRRTGVPSARRIQDAITAMQPKGFRGQRVRLTAPKDAVTRRISGAINRLSASNEVKRNLRKRLAAVKSVENSGFRVFKDSDGTWRWFGWATNKWRDKDSHADPIHGGEILTDAAHKEYIAWVDKNPARRMPALWPWHTQDAAHQQKADWLDYADGFVCLSGPLTDEEAKAIQRVAKEYDLGMSHGFYAMGRDRDNGHITKYRTFEVSYLPLEYAANPWTDFVTVEKEVEKMGFSESKRAMLALLAGEEFVAEVEQETEAKATMLQEVGVESKELQEEAPAESAAAEAEETATEEVEEPASGEPAETAEESTEATPSESEEPVEKAESEFIPRSEAIEAFGLLTDMVVELGMKIDGLSKSDEEKIAETVEKTPKASLKEIIAQRASQSEETVVDGRKKLAKSGPKETETVSDGGTGVGLIDGLVKMNMEKAQQLRQ